MLDEKKAFNSCGDFILGNGIEVSREKGLAWFDTEIKKAVDDVHRDLADLYDEQYKKNPLYAKRTYSSIMRKVKKIIEDNFKVLEKIK